METALVLSSNDNAPVVQNAGVVAIAERQRAEIESAIIVAKRFARDELAVERKVKEAFSRPKLAEKAEYCFPRGGAKIKGPSVDLAREIMRCWGNVRSGIDVIEETEDSYHIRGWAMDLETNAYSCSEDKFSKKIQRKNKDTGITSWVKPDERDARELLNRRAAFLERNCILKLLPKWLIESAQEEAANTKSATARGDLQKNRKDVLRWLVNTFDKFAVSIDMLTQYLGHSLEDITPEELAEFRTILTSLRDGQTKRHDHFSVKPTEDASAKVNDALKSAIPVKPVEPVVVPEQPKNSYFNIDGETIEEHVGETTGEIVSGPAPVVESSLGMDIKPAKKKTAYSEGM